MPRNWWSGTREMRQLLFNISYRRRWAQVPPPCACCKSPASLAVGPSPTVVSFLWLGTNRKPWWLCPHSVIYLPDVGHHLSLPERQRWPLSMSAWSSDVTSTPNMLTAHQCGPFPVWVRAARLSAHSPPSASQHSELTPKCSGMHHKALHARTPVSISLAAFEPVFCTLLSQSGHPGPLLLALYPQSCFQRGCCFARTALPQDSYPWPCTLCWLLLQPGSQTDLSDVSTSSLSGTRSCSRLPCSLLPVVHLIISTHNILSGTGMTQERGRWQAPHPLHMAAAS